MQGLAVSLLGRFEAQQDGSVLKTFGAVRVRELFSYLLIYRNRAHPRETLATLFWRDAPAHHSRKYLRQVLWQLQGALGQREVGFSSPLSVTTSWVQLRSDPGIWLDVADLEDAFASTRGVAGGQLQPSDVDRLRRAVGLYAGDLLEGCYQEWCTFERERLQDMYIAILDKLMGYCETHALFEEGLSYGADILRYDRARERTHLQLMRLHNGAGDRTAALRQYERCVQALRDELDVDPSTKTLILYNQIRSNQVTSAAEIDLAHDGFATTPSPFVEAREILRSLKRLGTVFAEAERRVRQEIATIETTMDADRAAPPPP